VKLRGEKPMKYVGDYFQKKTIKKYIFDNKGEFESLVFDIMKQMIAEFDYGYSLEFDLLLKEYFKFIPKFKVKEKTLKRVKSSFRFWYRSSMTEKEFNKFFDDFVSSLVNRIAVFILEEAFMPRLREAVMRGDYDIYKDEVNEVLFRWFSEKVYVISEEYRFWEDED
jgi:hypothetical protein